MPKFLLGKITVRTFETFAVDLDQARTFVRAWQEGEGEEPDGGIKATSYKMGWEESSHDAAIVVEARDNVLAAFLQLMQETIPGMPEKSRIITNPGQLRLLSTPKEKP
jgi:hypothetical protein